jgi:cytochrome c oxidase subunit 2
VRALAALAALLIAAATAGCGTGGPAESSGNASRGKDLFTGSEARCGGCHTLADAGTTATIGPSLDDAFARSRAEDFKESTIRNMVLDQIRYPTHGSGMPANLVHGQDAVDVASYVAKCAGSDDKQACPGPKQTGVYAQLGCQSCHSIDGSAGTGPTFKGLFGSQVKLKTGQTVTADAGYLLESILDPDKQIVEGYQPGVMSAAVKPGQVSRADALRLVAFIKAQK